MDEFKITPVKSKPRKTISRARKGADKIKDFKTCVHCPNSTVLYKINSVETAYRCELDKDKEVKIIPMLMSMCIHLIKPYKPIKADYIQQAYRDAKKWRDDK